MDFVDNNIQKVQVQPEDQVYARNEDIKVYGKLVSMSTENVVADSEQIWDEALKKNQSDINSQTQSKFGEYLPLTGGNINGNLNVDGVVGLNGTLTLGDSLHIEEGNFAFEGEDNESLTINFNGLTYAFEENQSQGFKVKEGDAQLNNITVIPKEHNDTDRRVSHISPGMITVDDGSNSANFTPTSIELSMSNDSVDTHVTAKTINTNEVLLRQSKAHGTQNVETSITPGLIRLHQTPGGSKHVTTIQPTGISSSMFQLTDGTDQDVLLGDGSTTNRLIKDVTAGAIQSEYNFNFITTGNVNKFVTINAATSTTAGVMTAADKVKLDDIENTYLPLSGGTLTGTLRLNEINSAQNGLDINNVYGMKSVDQYKVLHPEVWTTDGTSINILTLLENAAIYVAGGLEHTTSINNTTVVDSPNAIIFDSKIGSFLAKKDSVYYTHWNADISKNIASPSRYGIETNEGVFPFNNQMYKFSDDEGIYIAICINGTCSMKKLTLE